MIQKKGLSTVVTTLIIILLVLVAIGIVWVVIANVITQGSEQIFLDKFTTDLKIKNVLNEDNATNSVDIDIKRNAGKGDLAGIKFIFNDGLNSEIVEVTNTTLQELGEKRFHFILTILNISNIQTISIAPLYKSDAGKTITGGIIASYRLKGVGTYQGCVANCTGKICGNDGCGGSCSPGCDVNQYCSTDQTQCITGTCDLTSALWDRTTTTEGTTVYLNLQGNYCNGKNISFVVREDDGTGWTLADPVTTNPDSIIFSGSSSSGAWIAEYQCDGVACASDPPEYFFRASVVGESEYIESSSATVDELTVSQLGQPCDLTNAVWSQTNVNDATQVTLSVLGTNCAGQSIVFDIYEDDPFNDDFVTSLSGTYNSTTWTATWTYAGDDDSGLDPRTYYFDATYDQGGSDEDTVTSGILNVARVPGTCASEGGEICTGGDYCPSGHDVPSSESDCCEIGYCEPSSCDVCGDCETLFSSCSYSECNGCTANCLFLGSVSGEDCVDVSSCSSYVTQCSDYVQEECAADKCGVTTTAGCEWVGSVCQDMPSYPASYVIRAFSNANPAPNDEVIVTLESHSPGDEYLFVIQDAIPSGWEVTASTPPEFNDTSDPDILITYQAGEIFALPSLFSVTYTVRVPSTASGSYPFDGWHIFDSFIVQVASVTNGNGLCESTADKSQDEGNPSNPSYYPDDCLHPTFGPTSITVS